MRFFFIPEDLLIWLNLVKINNSIRAIILLWHFYARISSASRIRCRCCHHSTVSALFVVWGEKKNTAKSFFYAIATYYSFRLLLIREIRPFFMQSTRKAAIHAYIKIRILIHTLNLFRYQTFALTFSIWLSNVQIFVEFTPQNVWNVELIL